MEMLPATFRHRQPYCLKLQHDTVYHCTYSVMVIQFIIREHIMHVCNRESFDRIGFDPYTGAAGPAEVSDVSVMSVFLCH